MRYGSARQKSAEAQSSPAFYEWKPPGHPLSIQFNFAVIDQLEADVMKGFWAVPKRGAEVGGVLFGRVESRGDETTVFIDDYEPVECEYRRGPSFVLSEADRRRLEKILRKGSNERQVIGMYRSHTRLGLYLDQDDFSLIQNYFPGLNQVFLLVRPHASKSSIGGFFFWEEGNIHRQSTYLEFPFSRAEILKRTAGDQPPAEMQEAPPPVRPAAPPVRAAAPPVRAPAPPPEPPPVRAAGAPQMPPRETVSPWAAALSAAQPLLARLRTALQRPAPPAPVVSSSSTVPPPLMTRLHARQRIAPPPGPAPETRSAVPLLQVLAAQWAAAVRAGEPFAARMRVTRWRPIAVAAVALVCVAGAEYAILAAFSRRAPAGAAAAAAAADAPALRVDRTGNYLQVTWNRASSAIQHADRGILEITEGGHTKTLRLDSRQLRTGSVAYRPIGNEVTLRLDLPASNGTVSESLRVLDAAEPAVAVEPATFVNRPAPPAPAPVSRPAQPEPVAVKPQPPAVVEDDVQQASSKRSPRPARRHGFYDDGL